MKLAIIKAIISWLWRNHKYLLVEAVVGHGNHIHKNPPKRGGSRSDGPMYGANPATGGVDS